MKDTRLFLCTLLLLGGLTLQAAPVSKGRALEVAKRVLASQAATKSAGDVKLIWDGEEVATKSAVQPAFYVFGRDGGGFVIVAGDDNVQPVLAVSDHNEFRVEGMPENVKWWMESIKAYVRSSSAPTRDIQNQWNAFIATKASDMVTGTVTPTIEHITPEWDQGNNDLYFFDKQVFNASCPEDPNKGNSLSMVGCVAIALGEVVTYQSGQTGVPMPTKATGHIEYSSHTDGRIAPAPFDLGATYDWTKLRTLTNIDAICHVVDDTENPEASALLSNLARLLADIGGIMQAEYSADGTGASSQIAPRQFVTYFTDGNNSFNKGAYFDYANAYSNRRWIEKLQAEITKRPIVYVGTDPEYGGHAFVFDAFGETASGDVVFHINFGWGGTANGYYYNTAMDTGYGDNYRFDSGAIFDFYPVNEETTRPQRLVLESSLFSVNEQPYLVTGFRTNTEISKGVPFPIELGKISNYTAVSYSGTLKFKLVKKSGGDPIDLYSISIPAKLPDGIPAGYGLALFFDDDFQLTINSDLSFGDKVCAYYTDEKGNDVQLTGGKDGSVLFEIPVMPSAFIKSSDIYTIDDWFQFELTNHNYLYLGTVWTITEPDGTTVVKQQIDREHKLTKTGTYKIEAVVAEKIGGSVVETLVTYITVNEKQTL